MFDDPHIPTLMPPSAFLHGKGYLCLPLKYNCFELFKNWVTLQPRHSNVGSGPLNAPIRTIEHTNADRRTHQSGPSTTPMRTVDHTNPDRRTHQSGPSNAPIWTVEHTNADRRTHQCGPSNAPMRTVEHTNPDRRKYIKINIFITILYLKHF